MAPIRSQRAKPGHWRCWCADDASAGTRIAIETINQGYHNPNPRGRVAENFYTTHNARTVMPGQPAAFTLVVVPYGRETYPEFLTQLIAIGPQANAVRVTLAGKDGGQTEVEIGEGNWSVSRKCLAPVGSN